jgi:hypothetical protein
MALRRAWVIALLVLLLGAMARAQDNLDLLTELYILNNDGQLGRYGVGASGAAVVSPQGAFVVDFGVAPDGQWLAYRSPDAAYTHHMGTGETRPLAALQGTLPPVRGQGDTIAWAPDASAVAFTTLNGVRLLRPDGTALDADATEARHLSWSPDGRFLAVEAAGGVWWIYRWDGQALALTSAIPASTGTTWMRGGVLAFAPPEGGLVAMDLNNQNAQTSLLPAPDVYVMPEYLANEATLLVFRQQAQDPLTGSLQQVTQVGDMVRVVETGEATIALGNARWAPGGLLTALVSGGLALVDPATGQGFALPITATTAYGWGPDYPVTIVAPVVSQPLAYLAPDAEGVQQVWLLRGDATPPQVLTPATADVTSFAVSDALDQVVYVSDGLLWWVPTDGSLAPITLAELASPEDAAPTLHPDGTRVAYRDRGGVWGLVLPIGGAESTRTLLMVDDEVATYHTPTFGAAGMLLTSVVSADGGTGLAWLDPAPGVVQSAFGYRDATWVDRTRILAISTVEQWDTPADTLVILRTTAPDAPPQALLPVLGDLIVFMPGAVTPNGLRVLLQNGEPGPLRATDIALASRAITPLRGATIYASTPRMDRDGVWMVGTRYPGGRLLFHNHETGEMFLLAGAREARGAQWIGR